jgi:hypothetical protein
MTNITRKLATFAGVLFMAAALGVCALAYEGRQPRPGARVVLRCLPSRAVMPGQGRHDARVGVVFDQCQLLGGARASCDGYRIAGRAVGRRRSIRRR